MATKRTDSVTILLPNQLFKKTPATERVILVEDTLFFKDTQYPIDIHVNRLVLHRASMKSYEQYLVKRGHTVTYLDYQADKTIGLIIAELGVSHITMYDPVDFTLEKRIGSACSKHSIELKVLDNPLFINTQQENEDFFKTKKMRMGSFYKHQRIKLDLLVSDGEPAGDKWSFDDHNRKKIPNKEIPEIPQDPPASQNPFVEEARIYISEKFPDARGTSKHFFYPVNHAEANAWYKEFLKEKFAQFGPYEDAIVKDSSFLYHSVLSPLLNIGLIDPLAAVSEAFEFFEKNTETIALATIEGFMRQIIGWREFMRAVYVRDGVALRNANDWNQTRELPQSLYDGTTGLDPLDDAINGALKFGYSHHIERLMVIGNALFLTGIKPTAVYTWFMEMYVDAYDWVMVSNVYGMSQDTIDGQITTKPYFSGSNYIKKMSNYKDGEWAKTWDALYWGFIIDNQKRLAGNARWAFMVSMAQKMVSKKREDYLTLRDDFIKCLYE